MCEVGREGRETEMAGKAGVKEEREKVARRRKRRTERSREK